MSTGKDLILVHDYHAGNIEFRCFNEATGESWTGNYPTSRDAILEHLQQAEAQVPPGGGVVWIMESTTGWARAKDLVGQRAEFVLSNVLQMPLPPKARRRKTDKIDTARILREYLNGNLPRSFQPLLWWREVRRVVDYRQNLTQRQTAIKNWIKSLLHHETWQERGNLWTKAGFARLRATPLGASDRMLIEMKLEELERLQQATQRVERQMQAIYDSWPEAQWLDQMRGIGMVTAVSVAAHIGPIERFATADDLIAYAGLAPSHWQSDGTSHHGHVGGPGTDAHLRYLIIEATTWLCQIPRYQPAYERVMRKRGAKVARIVLARMVLRSIFKMLKDRVCFNPAPQVKRPAFIALGPAGSKEQESPAVAEPSRPSRHQSGARVARQRSPILRTGKQW